MRQIPINVGQQFIIKESGKVLLVIDRNQEKDPVFRVRYYDGSKEDLKLSESQIQKHLNFGSWIKTKI
jgi:hypothetical protein